MAYASATFADVRSFGGPAFPLVDHRRIFSNSFFIGLATVAAICAIGTAVIFSAAGILSAALSTNPSFRGQAPLTPELAALADPRHRLIGTAQFAGAAPALTRTAYARDLALQAKFHRAIASARAVRLPPKPIIARAESVPSHPAQLRAVPAKHDVVRAAALTKVARLTPAPSVAPAPVAPLAPKRNPDDANRVPLPPRRPSDAPQVAATPEVARATPDRAAPELTTASLPPPEQQKQLTPQQALNNSATLPGPDRRTAIYDIAAHTVYMPDGERLEAHSGLGFRRDDPRYVDEKRRGPTPPNVYELALREHLFHGVRAIRLNPVDDDKMFGRDGMLAHTYMLGPTGQSFGCVSFKHYSKFLQAFLNGKVDRLVVVSRLAGKPPRAARAEHRRVDHYAFNER
jgi:Tlde1 domain